MRRRTRVRVRRQLVRVARGAWIDALLCSCSCLVAGCRARAAVGAPLRARVEIDLSRGVRATRRSRSRGIVAYLLSLAFTLVYGTIAAHSRRAERS